ncbi:hypothetical protein BJ875DRAFT_374447 [Amylocarpus encephaloides]|uniref:DUF6594 domain-containing protein n=1 Tax=Amylocarpus encephaloides TaxID=45428 RepID=A0A9P8C6I8_9HELO|nr:hypothetical protein BJ875DRAFT_374447 [Amylocarpus encephaloides]
MGKERERDRERPRRHHKSDGSGNRHSSRSKAKNTSAIRSSLPAKEIEYKDGGQSRRRHSRSSRSRDHSSSSSESSENYDPLQSPRTILTKARARLTSPSTISTLTSMTTTTNKSSSSSGSNSTVTQASVTRRSNLSKKSDILEAPMSPAVPDAPNVFAYQVEDSIAGSKVDLPGEAEGHQVTSWANHLEDSRMESSLPLHMLHSRAGTSSSASSSFQGDDNFSEPPQDIDTDRSTSPESSVQGQVEEGEEQHEPEQETSPIDDTSAKIALQIAAAHQRQNYHGQMHSFGTPNMPRGPAELPHVPSMALSAHTHQQQVKQRPLPRGEKLPVSGYELLASQISSRPVSSNVNHRDHIKPIYRKFEALNHRLLLHLQDELSELEEQLHRLDHTDTQARRTENDIMPASRRAAAAVGGELQWHKTDVLGKIGFKLAQYNQALSSFNSTRSLAAPNREDVSNYRAYLQNANPIAEVETRFLDPEDDLVSIYSENISPAACSYSTSQATSSTSSSYSPSIVAPEFELSPTLVEEEHKEASEEIPAQCIVRALAGALAISVLIPILTFSVIPGFVGRITATSLVVGGVLVALMQGGVVEQGMIFRSEGLMCAGIYGGVMVVVAGIMPG